MNATDAARELLAAAPDALFVASLGTATSALRAASGDGPHLYLGGSMGAALAVAMVRAAATAPRGRRRASHPRTWSPSPVRAGARPAW